MSLPSGTVTTPAWRRTSWAGPRALSSSSRRSFPSVRPPAIPTTTAAGPPPSAPGLSPFSSSYWSAGQVKWRGWHPISSAGPRSSLLLGRPARSRDGAGASLAQSAPAFSSYWSASWSRDGAGNLISPVGSGLLFLLVGQQITWRDWYPIRPVGPGLLFLLVGRQVTWRRCHTHLPSRPGLLFLLFGQQVTWRGWHLFSHWLADVVSWRAGRRCRPVGNYRQSSLVQSRWRTSMCHTQSWSIYFLSEGWGISVNLTILCLKI